MISRHDYRMGGYVLSWDYDPDEHDARNLKDNNLYIEGIWNMSDTVGGKRPDTCTGVQIIDDKTFSFTTFRGMRYTMTIEGGKVELVTKILVK